MKRLILSITLAGTSSLLLVKTCTPVNNVNIKMNTNSGGFVTTLAGPNGAALDLNGNVYVADLGNNLFRKITT